MKSRKGSCCLPCRIYKRKCDHGLPCGPCVRTKRESMCRKNPSTLAVFQNTTRPTIFPKLPRPAKPSQPSDIVAEVNSEANYASHPLSVEEDIGPKPLFSGVQNQPPTSIVSSRSSVKVSTLFEQQIYNSVRHLPMSVLTRKVQSVDSTKIKLLDLVQSLPEKAQADILVDNYFKLFAHMYCSVNPPWFYTCYSRLWQCSLEDLDIRILGLVYAVMSVSCLELIPQKCEQMNMEPLFVRDLSDDFAKCSTQALKVSDFEKNADIISIMTISVLQSYFHSNKDPVSLNYYLRKSIAVAFELELHKEYQGTSAFQREVRHRLWWDIVSCDNYQTFCLNRAPIIRFDRYEIPFPVNCNDKDITEDSVLERPMDEYTHTSYLIYSLKLFKICANLRNSEGELSPNADQVIAVDRELCELLNSLPWYFRLTKDSEIPYTSPEYYDHPYLFHMFWTCVQTQRFRMHRSFLYPRIDYCYKVCLEASSNVLDVYTALRKIYISEKKDGLVIQGHNLFSASLAQVVFMLVENPPNSDQIRKDVEMAIADLDFFCTQGIRSKVVKEGAIILKELLALCSITYLGSSVAEPDVENSTSLLTKRIGYIFGGESAAEMYLHRLSIGYIVNNESFNENNQQTLSTQGWSSTRFENTAGEEFFTKESWETWDLGDWSKFFQ
ncbi:unnamed protein product [Kuraishia capsulata CBS 1993]|uniref:Xylanolytic transcriptional activator regulatory domain-containing protein n=1 Tax=Kuraishia capsulata CBS 1993 TaxID=1382522 RepID=W6MTG4_9ASCO|nr:uncharacterized protein KUCA_T00005731001 [Kuraishia capsulata CBS 1993]CDK29738.1 unnamed protein product [Kuraishia capsulata CBS 1993]